MSSCSWLSRRGWRVRGATHRHTAWLLVLVMLVVLPTAQLVVPVVHVSLTDWLSSTFVHRPAAVPEPPPASPELSASMTAPASILARPGTADPLPPGVPLALALVWAAGAFLVVVRPGCRTIGLLSNGAIRRRAARAPSIAAEALLPAGIREIHVMAHPRVALPFTYGIWRPTILLPSAWTGWSRERLGVVLVHELAHVRRRDALSNAVAQIACAFVWFNPLAWIARSLLRHEAEVSCDQEVLRQGIPPTRYASTLVGILKQGGGMTGPAHGIAFGRKGMLKDRLRRILSQAPIEGASAPVWKTRSLVPAALVMAVLLLSVSFRGVETLNGIWHALGALNVASDNIYTWYSDGTGSVASAALPDVPSNWYRYAIEKKWADRRGFTWYHIRVRYSHEHFVLYTLIRIAPGGNLYEKADSPLGYPAEFLGPPGDENDLMYVRH